MSPSSAPSTSGAHRKFPKDAIIAATHAAGGTDVATHATSGNVRLTSALTSTDAVAAALEKAYAADRGFEVPAIVLTCDELTEITEVGAELEAGMATGRSYVTLYAAPPPRAAAKAAEALTLPGETTVVRGRAAYLLLEGAFHSSATQRAKEFLALGTGTGRTQTVLETLVGKWC